MAKKTSRFAIGLFVTIGVSLGVAAVVWLGASKYFEKGALYLTYFDESVQGLQVDSRVKYRGVDVGKVEKIRVAPDQKLVEVLIKVALAGDIEQTIVTQLKAAGITGIVFVELDQRKPGDEVLRPPDGMETSYPVIPSQTSQTKQMLSSVDRIMDRMEKVDLLGISDQIKATSRAVEVFFSGQQMRGLLTNLDLTATGLGRSIGRVDRILADGKVDGVFEGVRTTLDETRQGIAETRQLVSEVGGQIKNLQIGETTARMNRLLDGLDRRTRVLTADVESTTEEIRLAAENLRLLIDRLRDNPSDLIFSSPRGGETKEGR